MTTQSATWYDVIYPAFAFCAVIVVPSLIALWVIFRTVTEKTLSEGER